MAQGNRARDWAVALLLAAATVWAFRGVARAGFVHFDDGPFIVENPHLREGLGAAGLHWALTADLLEDSPHTDYWSPLTLTSRLLDVELFGFDVLLGSFKEHQPRAAWMGLGMFGGLGVVLILVASGLTW